MEIVKLIDIIWENATSVEFGEVDAWDDDTFLSGWFDDFIGSDVGITKPNSPGLYWFETNSNLGVLNRPVSLPDNGCDFLETNNLTNDLFGAALLTQKNGDLRIVYNGHEKNVMSRVRSHFNLSNNRTGALGLRHYPVSGKYWRLFYFTMNDVPFLNVSQLERDRINLLLSDKPGRNALESAWRAKYGWPELCKA